MHPACRRAGLNAKQREGYARWTAEQRAASWARAHAADRRDEQVARETATRTWALWTEGEDRYLLDHPMASARDLALALGRTVWGVKQRRRALQRLEAARASAATRSP